MKLSGDHFAALINSMCSQEQAFSEEKFDEVMETLEKAFAEGASPPYAGDLENEAYKVML